MARIKLLLADKNVIFCEGLAKVLERERYFNVVCTCHEELEVIQRVDEHEPDMVLIGIESDEYSGLEAIQGIRKRLPNTKIIVLTHSERYADFLSAYRAGARAYISKDIYPEDLIKAINLVAKGEVIIISSAVAKTLLQEISLLEKHEREATKEGVSLISKREREVMRLVAQGFTNREIAGDLFISEQTVKVHLRNIMEKLHAHTRERAVALLKRRSVI